MNIREIQAIEKNLNKYVDEIYKEVDTDFNGEISFEGLSIHNNRLKIERIHTMV